MTVAALQQGHVLFALFSLDTKASCSARSIGVIVGARKIHIKNRHLKSAMFLGSSKNSQSRQSLSPFGQRVSPEFSTDSVGAIGLAAGRDPVAGGDSAGLSRVRP